MTHDLTVIFLAVVLMVIGPDSGLWCVFIGLTAVLLIIEERCL